jgi:hypothetical protein
MLMLTLLSVYFALLDVFRNENLHISIYMFFISLVKYFATIQYKYISTSLLLHCENKLGTNWVHDVYRRIYVNVQSIFLYIKP